MLSTECAARILWDIRYFLGRYSYDWYASLFELGDGKVKGEITLSYSILDLKDVEAIRKLMPKLKIFLILRNPVECAWSQIRFDGIQDKSFADLKEFICSPVQDLRSNYIRTIKDWRSYFPKEQFYVGFYDDINLGLTGVMSSVCEFLGVSTGELDIKKVNSTVNVSACKKIDSEREFYLTKKTMNK